MSHGGFSVICRRACGVDDALYPHGNTSHGSARRAFFLDQTCRYQFASAVWAGHSMKIQDTFKFLNIWPLFENGSWMFGETTCLSFSADLVLNKFAGKQLALGRNSDLFGALRMPALLRLQQVQLLVWRFLSLYSFCF
jgi:hypothetical protein